MPTYEYHCERCGHRFEIFQSIKAAPKRRCPQCKGKLRRVIGTGAGMIFKGSGFYITDYRSDSYKSEKSKESGEKPQVKPEPKSESKPELPKSEKTKRKKP